MHTLILGFDSFDPQIFEQLSSQAKLPNLTKFADAGGYSRFIVSDPPQTEVSWTSIATGLDPGGHGIFDFVHRDPASYTPYVSLLPTRQVLGGVQFVPPHNARTLFDEAALMGFPATSLWWPGTFPARLQSPVRTIPGLGTPDVLGRLGVGTLYSTDAERDKSLKKTTFKQLQRVGTNRYISTLDGPIVKKREAQRTASLDLHLDIIDEQSAYLIIDNHKIELKLGSWSPYLELSFKVGLFFSVQALTRAILTQIEPDVHLYFLPLQIHPLGSTFRYAAPPSFAKQLWKNSGPYLTLGWPQDTTGLEEGCISDQQFLELCTSIFASRERVLVHLLNSFREGVLGIIFDCLDRIHHMFLRDRMDIVEQWYVKLDQLVGNIETYRNEQNQRKFKLLILSDHGFTLFRKKVHLNRWLLENTYLSIKHANGSGGLGDADWSRSQAYAVGLNSLYLNLQGREGQGIVSPEQYPLVVEQIREQLIHWRDADGSKIVQRALKRDEVFSAPLMDYGPDILIGYSPGYRASAETGLGRWEASSLELNNDHWGADHCIDSQAVPGVIFSNHNLQRFRNLSFRDIPLLAIGKELKPSDSLPPQPPSIDLESQKIIEERLKSLGYL